MQRIKHHYCWVKAFEASDDDRTTDEPLGSEGLAVFGEGTISVNWPANPNAVSSRLSSTPAHVLRTGVVPFSATGTFSSLTGTAWPALRAGDLEAAAAQIESATGVFRALIGKPLPAVSPSELRAALLSATGTFKVLSNRPIGALNAADLAADEEAAVAEDAPTMEMTGAVLAPDAAGMRGVPGGASSMVFAGASFMGAWQFDSHTSDGVRLAFMPIVGSRQDALAWRNSQDGVEWAEGALAITLLSFAAIGEF